MNKFAARDAAYLSARTELARRLGRPDLFAAVDHFPLFAGSQTLARTLALAELFRSTLEVPGHILEFGCWQGDNLAFMGKLLNLFAPNSPKLIYGFDSFEGLKTFSEEDGLSAAAAQGLEGKYRGNLETLREVLALYGLDSFVELVIGDACQTIAPFFAAHPEMLVSYAYIDFDLYQPCKAALDHLHRAMSTGGLIVFDEANCANWVGESRALMEFLGEHGADYAMESRSFTRQPTVALRRR